MILPDILGEVKCLKLELDTERTRAEQERDAVARQLAQAEQEGQAALERQKVAHEEEVNRLQEKWVGGGCGWGMGRQAWPPFSESATCCLLVQMMLRKMKCDYQDRKYRVCE